MAITARPPADRPTREQAERRRGHAWRVIRGMVVFTLFVVVAPALLHRAAGTPGSLLLDGLGAPASSAGRAIEDAVTGAIALLAWLIWAQFAYALAITFIAKLRNRPARQLRILPGLQTAAGQLLGVGLIAISAATTTGLTATPAHATPTAETVDEGQGSAVVSARPLAEYKPASAAAPATPMPGETAEETEPITPPAPPNALSILEIQSVREIVVGEGDHFWSIAETHLTSHLDRTPTTTETTAYWAQIVELNKDQLLPPGQPDLIYPGQRIVIPDLTPTPEVERPSSTMDSWLDHEPGIPTTTAVARVAELQPAAEQTPPADPTSQQSPEASRSNPATTAAAQTTPAATEDSEGAINRNLAIGAAGLTGAMALQRLRRRRHVEAAVRTPNTTHHSATDAPPPPELEAAETRIRAIATNGDDIATIDAANRYLTARLNESTPNEERALPRIVAVRAGNYGLELLLDEPCTPITGFTASSPTSWTLDADFDHHTLNAATTPTTTPYAPALAVLGATPAGNLLVDLEQLGTLAINGTPAQTSNALRAITASLLAAPWATTTNIVAITNNPPCHPNITIPADPMTWATELADELTTAATNPTARSPHQHRIDDTPTPAPIVVTISDHPDGAAITQLLTPVTQLAHSSLALITTHPTTAEHHLDIHLDNTATLEPHAITLTPTEITPEQFADLNTVLNLSAPDAEHHTTQQPPEITDGEPEPIRHIFDAAGPESDSTNGADQSADAESSPSPFTDNTQTARAESGQDQNDETGEVGDTSRTGDVTEAAEDTGQKEREPEPTEPEQTEPETTEPETTEPEKAVPSPGVQELINQILEPRPIEVTILDRKPTISGLAASASPKLESIIVYLTYHQQIPSDRLRDEFWPTAKTRAAADNALNRVRSLLGTNANTNTNTNEGADGEDQPRLASARNTGTYELDTTDIGFDWQRAQPLIEAAGHATNQTDELAYLQAAINLIRGPIATDAHTNNYDWLLRDPVIYTTIETVLVDAAHRAAELALQQGNCELAKWAANKGLLVVAGQEALYRLRMQAAHIAGDPDGINQAFREAQRAATHWAGEIQAETQALYEQLKNAWSGN